MKARWNSLKKKKTLLINWRAAKLKFRELIPQKEATHSLQRTRSISAVTLVTDLRKPCNFCQCPSLSPCLCTREKWKTPATCTAEKSQQDSHHSFHFLPTKSPNDRRLTQSQHGSKLNLYRWKSLRDFNQQVGSHWWPHSQHTRQWQRGVMSLHTSPSVL